MEVTYIVVITLMTYCMGAFTKAIFTSVPTRFIPLQNVIIGIISGLVCFFSELEPNLLTAIVLCLTASMGAGGYSDLSKITDSVEEL